MCQRTSCYLLSNCETPLKPIAEAAVFFKKSRRFMASLLEEDVGLSLRYGPRYPGSSRVLQQLPATGRGLADARDDVCAPSSRSGKIRGHGLQMNACRLGSSAAAGDPVIGPEGSPAGTA